MSVWEELKRRNVIRVGLAYVVLGWVVIQVTDVVAPALQLPDWTLRLVIWIGLIGLPFALFFAWAFEITPEGIQLESRVDREHSITPQTGRKLDVMIVALLLAAVGMLAAERFLPRYERLSQRYATPLDLPPAG